MHELGTGSNQMLAVIHNEQELLLGQKVDQRLGRRPPLLFRQAEDPTDSSWKQRRVANRGQVDPEEGFLIRLCKLARDFDRQPCLSTPARSSQSQKACSRQQALDIANLSLPADEPRQLDRDIWSHVGVTLPASRNRVLREVYGAVGRCHQSLPEICACTTAAGRVLAHTSQFI
ncbi:MAG: hypothetical protein RRC07_11125 [Anaerolineae bacterium]|nr:hypothetical protein [Anaerolineae bacterium]